LRGPSPPPNPLPPTKRGFGGFWGRMNKGGRGRSAPGAGEAHPTRGGKKKRFEKLFRIYLDLWQFSPAGR